MTDTDIMRAYRAGVRCGLAGSSIGMNPPTSGGPLAGHFDDGWNDATIALAEAKKVIAESLCEEKAKIERPRTPAEEIRRNER